MPRRIFMVRDFARFARRNRIADTDFVEIVARADLGIVDADLGGGLVKLRLARPGEGRSGGYRTIVAYRSGSDVFFLYGFAKNDQENIARNHLADLQAIGRIYLHADERGLELALKLGELTEIEELE